VDLSEGISEMIITQHGYGANLQTVKAQDEVLGEALDILG
jgi:flagellar hook protein FlgE